MPDPTPDFYITSTEGYGMEAPRACYSIKRMRGDRRDDYLLVRIDPPLVGEWYGPGTKDVDVVVVATRHMGDSLFPISNWPLDVHVAQVLVDAPEQRDVLAPSDMRSIAWAELYPTETSARGKTV